MEDDVKFLYYKKLLIFGSEGVGKTTLSSILEDHPFKEERPSIQGKSFN